MENLDCKTNLDIRERDIYSKDIKHALHEEQRSGHWLDSGYEWAESCIYAVIFMLLIFSFVMRTVTVAGISMAPTLQEGDRLLLLEAGYWDPQYGDVVVIDRTLSEQPPIIKRVIGRAGDTIDIDFHTGTVERNGEVLDEPYVAELTTTQKDVQFPVTVQDGCLFVMGDNRNHSADSRSGEIGMVDVRYVLGKAVYRFFPVGNMGPVA